MGPLKREGIVIAIHWLSVSALFDRYPFILQQNIPPCLWLLWSSLGFSDPLPSPMSFRNNSRILTPFVAYWFLWDFEKISVVTSVHFFLFSVGEDGTPNIRPLETLHNALSLRQVDGFLEHITNANYKTPNLSPKTETPPENPSMIQDEQS